MSSPLRSAPRGAGALGLALVALLVSAPSAFATDVTYTVPPPPGATVDREDGTVELTYGACVPAGTQASVPFKVRIEHFSKAAPANFVVTTESGQPVAATVTPATVLIARNATRNYDVALNFSYPAGVTTPSTFRVTLVPTSGERVHTGRKGLLVRVPCAQAATPPAAVPVAVPQPAPLAAPTPTPTPTPPATVNAVPTAPRAVPSPERNCLGDLVTNRNQTRSSERPDNAAERLAQGFADCDGALRTTAPGQFPAVNTNQARRPAARVRIDRRRVRAGETTTLCVTLEGMRGDSESGSVIRVSGPGVTVKDVTDSRGRACVRVRPRRPGTLVVQSDRVPGSRRIPVLAPRVAQARAQPRFTG